MTWKVSDSDYKYIEDELRLYPFYKRKLDIAILNTILSTPEHDDNGGGKSNLPGRPIENIVIRLFDDARIAKLRRYVEAVEDAFSELDDEKKRFVQAVFWDKPGKTIQVICHDFAISYVTYLRWKKAILLRVGLITGDYRGEIR